MRRGCVGAARGVAADARPVEPLPASGRFELSSAASSQRAVSSRAAVNGGSKSTFDTPLATAIAHARTKTGQALYKTRCTRTKFGAPRDPLSLALSFDGPWLWKRARVSRASVLQKPVTLSFSPCVSKRVSLPRGIQFLLRGRGGRIDDVHTSPQVDDAEPHFRGMPTASPRRRARGFL